MKYIFVSYVFSKGFTDPATWLKRINAYAGILEALAVTDNVISIEQIDYEGTYVKDNVQYEFVKLSPNQKRFPTKLHGFIKKQQPDIVVVHSLHFQLQVIQLRLILPGNTKIIVQNHAERPFSGIKRQLQKLADQCIDAYLFASKTMGLGWVKRGNIARTDKVHEVMEVSSVFYPINRQAALSKTGASGQPIFLWVGRLNGNKDPLMVIGAFIQFLAHQPQAKLYMIYHTNELLNAVHTLLNKHHRCKDNIILLGKLPHADLLYWFNSADYILSGSRYEGSGTAVCEAMSCGCIPVVTDIDSFRMITDNGNCGILYEAGNQQALLTALQQTRQMDSKTRRQASLDYYESTLSFDAIASKVRGIAKGLLV